MSEELDNIDILNSEVCNYLREGNAQIFFICPQLQHLGRVFITLGFH